MFNAWRILKKLAVSSYWASSILTSSCSFSDASPAINCVQLRLFFYFFSNSILLRSKAAATLSSLFYIHQKTLSNGIKLAQYTLNFHQLKWKRQVRFILRWNWFVHTPFRSIHSAVLIQSHFFSFLSHCKHAWLWRVKRLLSW